MKIEGHGDGVMLREEAQESGGEEGEEAQDVKPAVRFYMSFIPLPVISH